MYVMLTLRLLNMDVCRQYSCGGRINKQEVDPTSHMCKHVQLHVTTLVYITTHVITILYTGMESDAPDGIIGIQIQIVSAVKWVDETGF
jgi:hypothetical protein